MKTHKLSIVGGAIGIAVMVISAIRYFLIWDDPSQGIIGISIGVIILGGAYVYNWMKEVDERFEKLNKRLDAFTDWWAKQELR